MISKIFNLDWDKFDYNDRVQRLRLAGALQCYMAMPNKFIPPKLAKIAEFVKAHKALQAQMFTLVSDFPAKPLEVIEKFHAAPEYDNGYEQIFDVADFSASRVGGFDILNVEAGLTFKEIKPGEKLKVYQMSGDKEHCYFSYYGGALGWHRQLFEDQEYWTLDDNAIEFRSVAYSSRAAVYYALLEAAADLKGCCKVIASDCSDCTADAKSIAESINYAARIILENCRNKGYNLSPQTTQFIVLTPLGMRGRVRQALSVRLQAFSDSEKSVDYNFIPITSMMLLNPTRIMVILPKRKMKIGYRMNLTLFGDFDILSYTETSAGWMRHGGCIGDLDQLECIEFTDVSGSCPTSPTTGVGSHTE